jgi:hypothetical protein
MEIDNFFHFWTLPRNGGVGLRSNPDSPRQTVKMQMPKGVTMGIGRVDGSFFLTGGKKGEGGYCKEGR